LNSKGDGTAKQGKHTNQASQRGKKKEKGVIKKGFG